MSLANPRSIIAKVAREYLGLRETSTNRGPHLAEFWKATSYPDGAENREPWCSAFVTFCVQEADRRSPQLNLRVPPTFPAVAQWLPWAQKEETGCIIFRPVDVLAGRYHPLAGDLVVYLPRLSHIGIVAEDFTAGSQTIVTIEGNTNDGGSREGDGVYERHRLLSFCGSFIRVPAIGEEVSKAA